MTDAMKRLLFIAMAALALCFAACEKNQGGSDVTAVKSIKFSNLIYDEPHFVQEYAPTYTNGLLTKVVAKAWNSTTWTEDGKPAGLIQNSEMVYNIKWDEKTHKISGTVDIKWYDEEKQTLVPAEKNQTVSGTFNDNHDILSYTDGMVNRAYEYDGNRQITKYTVMDNTYNYNWEGGLIVRHDVWSTTHAEIEYGNETNDAPANANIVMGLFLSGDELPILGLCGVGVKKIPVKYNEVSTGEYGNTTYYVVDTKRDASGRISYITRYMVDGTTGEAFEGGHVERWEIIY